MRPLDSWITGPDGTVGVAGTAPRSAGTVRQTTLLPSGIQPIGQPAAALSCSAASRRALALRTSMIHGSMRLSPVNVNATWAPSGDQLT